MSDERCPACGSEYSGPNKLRALAPDQALPGDESVEDVAQTAQGPTLAPPQDGDEIETAFEALDNYWCGCGDRIGVDARAALATIHRTMEGLRAAARCERTHVDPDSQHLLDIIERQEAALREATSRAEQAEAAITKWRQFWGSLTGDNLAALSEYGKRCLSEAAAATRTALSRTSSTDTPETEDE